MLLNIADLRYFVRPTILLAGILGAWCLNARAVTTADAEAALARGDYASAVPIYESLVTAGETDAMVALARLYQTGTGVQKNLPRAVELFTTAAKRDNSEAEFSLGNLYLMGEGVPQDDDWAFTYYRKAAEHGHPLAQKNVTEFYRAAGIAPAPVAVNPPRDDSNSSSPPAVPPPTDASAPAVPTALSVDEEQAIEAARARGFVVDLDPNIAPANSASEPSPVTDPALETSAAAPAIEPAAASLAEIRELLAVGKTAQAQVKLEPLANHNNAEAQFLLSQVLETAALDATSADQALEWLKLAAAAGFAEAEFKLAERYLSGRGLVPDEAEAITWYRSAARHGHAGAKQKLEAFYRDAGIPIDGGATPPVPKAVPSARRPKA